MSSSAFHSPASTPSLALRGRSTRNLPTRNQLLLAVLVAGVLVSLPFVVTGEYLDLLNQSAIAIVGAIGLGLLTGYAGQISLGQAALLGIGGFTAGILTNDVGIPFPFDVVGAIMVGALVGVVLGLPALRLRGLYLALATMGFHFVVVYFLIRYQAAQTSIVVFTGLRFDPPSLGIITIDSLVKWYFFLLVVVIACLAFVTNLTRTRPGRAWIAIRDNELVAATLGVSLTHAKLAAFVVSSALAAFAGALLGHYNLSLDASTYTLDLAVIYVVMIIAGGLGSTSGAVIGAIVVTMLPHVLTTMSEWAHASSSFQIKYLIPMQTVIFGLLLVGFLLLEPTGLVGIFRRLRHLITNWPFRDDIRTGIHTRETR